MRVHPDRALTAPARSASGSRLARLGDTLGLDEGRFGWRWVLAVAVAALVTASLLYRLASVAVTLPLLYEGDALLHAAYVKRLQEAGWYLDNARLGAPWGLDAADFPLGGENVHWLGLTLLGVVAPTPWAAINAYHLVTYPLVAMAAFVVLRTFRMRPVLAAGAALLFAFLPFHQYRGVLHLLRSGYFIVPFLVLGVLWLAQPGRYLAPVAGRATLAGFRRDRLALLAVLALVSGANDTQNTAYGVLLIVLLSVAGSLSSRSFRPTLVALGFAVVAGLSLVANNAPYLHKQLTEGTNAQVATREAWEQEVYGLRAARLLLPIPGHRIDALDSFVAELDDGITPGEQGSQALGVVGGIAALSTLLAAGAVVVGRRDRAPSPQLHTAAVCGLVSLVAIAVAAPGGLAFLLSALGLTLYRTWNRISTFIAFGSLLGGVLLVELALAGLRGRWRALARRRVVAALAVVVTVVGVLDQTPPSERLTQTEEMVRAFSEDRAFYEAVEARHPEGAMVFQLPVTTFPEGGATADLPDYEQLTAYLHTDDLRWSGAAMRGRPASYWQEQLTLLSARDTVRAAAAAGFAGAVVYQRGYEDGGARIGAALDELAGPPTVIGARDLTHHDLAPVHAALVERTSSEAVAAAGAALVDPVRVEPPAGLGALERSGDERFRWSADSDATYRIVNPSDHERTVTFSGSFAHADPEMSWIRIAGPGIDRSVTPGHGPITWTATVAPGTHELRITSDGVPLQPEGDPRTLGLRHGAMVAIDAEARVVLCGEPDPEPRPYCLSPSAGDTPPGGREEA